MMKIRIIELLNKIANGEEVPKKIKREYGLVYTLNFGHETPTYYDDNDRTLWDGYNFNILNEDVEILEDNTEEIEEIELIGTNFMDMDKNQLKDEINKNRIFINKLRQEIFELRKDKNND